MKPGKDYGLYSRRIDKLLAIGGGSKSKFLTFSPICVPYYPAFSGLHGIESAKGSDVLEICEMDEKNGLPTKGKILGKLDLWELSLEEVCPVVKSLHPEDSEQLADSNESSGDEDESEESDRSEDSSAMSDEPSLNDDGSEYEEWTWRDIIDRCPDEFEFVSRTRRLVLQPDRQNHQLKLVSLTLFFNKRRENQRTRSKKSKHD